MAAVRKCVSIERNLFKEIDERIRTEKYWKGWSDYINDLLRGVIKNG